MIFLFPLKKIKQIFREEKKFLSHPFCHYLKLHVFSVSIVILSLVFTNFFFALVPLFIGRIIDQINKGIAMSETLKVLFLFFFILVFLFLSRYIWRIYWGDFRYLVAENLQKKIFNVWIRLGPEFYSKHSVGKLVSLINNDVNAFNMAIGPGLLVLFDVSMILLFIGYFMISISFEWMWKCLIFLPFVSFLAYFVSRLIRIQYKVAQDQFAKMSGNSEEIISGIRVIKSYNLLEHQTKNFNELSRDFEKACLRVEKTEAFFQPIINFALSLSGLILLLIAAPDILAGKKSLGDFMAFFQYIQQLTWPLFGMSFGANLFKKGEASFQRISNLFSFPVEVLDQGKKEIKSFRQLNVKNLHFQFKGKKESSLKNISFQLNKGENLGVLGLVGSGKTSLLLLFLRYYSINKNQVFLNSQCITEISLKSLRRVMAYVPQESFLFSDTVLNNIFIGKSDKKKEIASLSQFLDLLSLKEEIETFSNGLNMNLGERGVNLSGGQKQRLSILRALVQEPDVLILDDNLRATDVMTAKKALSGIRAFLKERGKTLIMVSQRMSDFDGFDKLLVLNKDGTQECFGALEEVKKNSLVYKELSRLQGHM